MMTVAQLLLSRANRRHQVVPQMWFHRSTFGTARCTIWPWNCSQMRVPLTCSGESPLQMESLRLILVLFWLR